MRDVGSLFCRAHGNHRGQTDNNSIHDQSGWCASFACSEVDIFVWLGLPDYRGSDDNYRGDRCSLDSSGADKAAYACAVPAICRRSLGGIRQRVQVVLSQAGGSWVKGLGGVRLALIWGVGMLVLVSGFAITAYKGARGLRGTAPELKKISKRSLQDSSRGGRNLPMLDIDSFLRFKSVSEKRKMAQCIH